MFPTVHAQIAIPLARLAAGNFRVNVQAVSQVDIIQMEIV